MELGLGHYNCGNVILSNGYASKVLNSSMKYKERFETSIKELHKELSKEKIKLGKGGL